MAACSCVKPLCNLSKTQGFGFWVGDNLDSLISGGIN